MAIDATVDHQAACDNGVVQMQSRESAYVKGDFKCAGHLEVIETDWWIAVSAEFIPDSARGVGNNVAMPGGRNDGNPEMRRRRRCDRAA